jgi:hypothetical protein
MATMTKSSDEVAESPDAIGDTFVKTIDMTPTWQGISRDLCQICRFGHASCADSPLSKFSKKKWQATANRKEKATA